MRRLPITMPQCTIVTLWSGTLRRCCCNKLQKPGHLLSSLPLARRPKTVARPPCSRPPPPPSLQPAPLRSPPTKLSRPMSPPLTPPFASTPLAAATHWSHMRETANSSSKTSLPLTRRSPTQSSAAAAAAAATSVSRRSRFAVRAIRAQVWGPLQSAITGSAPLPFEPSAAPLNSLLPRLQQLQVSVVMLAVVVVTAAIMMAPTKMPASAAALFLFFCLHGTLQVKWDSFAHIASISSSATH